MTGFAIRMDWVRMDDELEILWGNLLSEEADKILAIWHGLEAEEQAAIHAHLLRMATEEGWSQGQQIAAQAALNTIDAASHP
jgi:hypothetical protein